MLSIIVAIDEKNGIGKDNRLLCHLPDDLKHFKTITSGKTVIMGENTYYSLPNGPLPNRKNIVLTFNPDLKIKGVIVCQNLEEAISHTAGKEEVFIIGGASVYKQTFTMADKLYITRIENAFEADTFFPEITSDTWKLIASERHEADQKNPYAYRFEEYVRL